MTATLTLPLKWFGGKQYLARRIVSLFPRHRHFVEAFGGGLAVLLERDPNDPKLWVSESSQQAGVSEVANDLNGHLMNFSRAVACRSCSIASAALAQSWTRRRHLPRRPARAQPIQRVGGGVVLLLIRRRPPRWCRP